MTSIITSGRIYVFVFGTILLGCKLADKKTTGDNADQKNTWVQLFDGKTITQWHTYGKDSAGKAWNVEDSSIHLNAAQKEDSMHIANPFRLRRIWVFFSQPKIFTYLFPYTHIEML